MGLFGDLVQVGFGGPPKMLPWQTVNAQQQQQVAITGNSTALPYAQNLASRIDTFNQGEIQRMLELAMPGYAKLRDKGTGMVSDFMSGKVPGDVSNAVQTSAAARSAYGGFGGTGMSKNLTARDLGMTGLDLMGKGLDSATKWISMARTLAPTYDVSNMFISPTQQLSFAVNERNNSLSYQNTKQQFDYATDPMRAVEKDVGGIADMIGTALMAYMGGGVGAMGGAGGAAGGAGGGLGGMMGGIGGGSAAGSAAAGGGGFMSGLGGMFGMGAGGGSSSAMQMIQGFGGMFGGSKNSISNLASQTNQYQGNWGW